MQMLKTCFNFPKITVWSFVNELLRKYLKDYFSSLNIWFQFLCKMKIFLLPPKSDSIFKYNYKVSHLIVILNW